MQNVLQNYSVRESKRAKHVGLRVSLQEGLVVVIPEGFNPRKIPEILERKEQWITYHMRKQAERRRVLAAEAPERLSRALPKIISLKALDEDWRVIYRPTTSKMVNIRADEEHNRLIVYGKINDKAQVRAVLKAWLKEMAENTLSPWLEEISEDLGLRFRQLSIRNQKGRWGSCTSRKAISLNQKLLFVPSELVQYILVHELCHTVHMNHSKSFWRLVKRFEPEYEEYDREMSRDAWERYVPLWCE